LKLNINCSQTVGKEIFLKNLISNKKTASTLFQVLLLDNGSGEDVEVQEAAQVNFLQVKEHLKNGGSVFITSKDSQKIAHPKTKAQVNYSRSRKNLGVLFRQHVRRS
jgi:hypothetical protein